VLDEIGARIPPRRRSATDQPEDAGSTPAQNGAGSVSEGAPSGPVPVVAPPPPGVWEREAAAVVTGALFAGAAIKFGAVPELAAYCVLFGGLVAISVADLRVRLVPRVILYPTLALMTLAFVAAAAVARHWHPLLDAAIGGAVCFAVFFVIWFIAPRGMGFGDVRLAGLIGAGLGWLGFGQVFVGFLAAFVVGAVIGLVLMTVKGTGRKTALPFGPALAAGCVFGVLFGGTLAHLWLHTGG